MVAVRDRDLPERLARVAGAPGVDVEDTDRLRVHRIGIDVVVVPGPLAQLAVLGAALPGATPIVAAEHRAVLRLDDRPDPVRARRRDRDPDLPQDPLRKPLGPREIGPGVAAVGGLEQPAARASAAHLIRPADRLPERREQDARVLGVDAHIDRARGIAPREHLLPGGPAVAGAEQTALGIWPVGVTERRDVDGIRIVRVDPHLADLPGVGEAEVAPAASAIGRAIDPVAMGDVAPDRRLAHTRVDDIGIGRRDREGPDRRALEVAVAHVAPVQPAVVGLPDPAAGRPHVEGLPVARIAGHGDHPAAAERAELAPLETVKRDRRAAGRGGPGRACHVVLRDIVVRATIERIARTRR